MAFLGLTRGLVADRGKSGVLRVRYTRLCRTGYAIVISNWERGNGKVYGF